MKTLTKENNYYSKIWIYNAVVGLCLIFLVVQYFKGRRNIAYIDSARIYNGYKGIKLAKKEFETKVEFYKSRTDTLNARVKISMMNVERAKNDRGSQIKLIDSVKFYKKQLNDYQLAMNESLREEESKLTQKAMTKLNEFLKEYGESHGYEMILIASPSGTIAYAKDKYDITDKVLEAANEKL